MHDRQNDSYELKLQKLCDGMLTKDASIRFVGVANHFGSLVTSSYRADLVPLMTNEETRQYALEAVTRALMRETFQTKTGRLRYAIGVYEKLIRATLSIPSRDHDLYLLISFDIGSDATAIIEKRMLPQFNDLQAF